jgi:pyrroloquinoline quinone (PQQ) biosynthesis protein C
MTHSDLFTVLVAIGEDSVRRLDQHPVGRLLVLGRPGRPRYVHYLTQVVHQVRVSGPLLLRAGSELERRGRLELASLFTRKAGEEDGHHLWALDDLIALGVPAAAVEGTPPSSAVEAYRAWALYASACAPLAIVGLAFILEWLSYARAGQAADNLVAHSGIAGVAGAVRFLRSHADADAAHIEAFRPVVSTITDADEIELVTLSARLTATLYLGFFEEEATQAA